ncbi:MAG: hypothetical protein DLM70_00585 [Chloroflexi bacterium]|nr:MAG: hypothetical protein DLM70_00585 [Chloroflexota bacterium]
MPITLLHDHRPEARVVLPRQTGIEERDVRAFPLPPNTSVALLASVVRELRTQGYVIDYDVKREQLADWDVTRRKNQRDDEWFGSGDTLIHFVPGGFSIIATVNGREVHLQPRDFRGGRQGMRFALTGRV